MDGGANVVVVESKGITGASMERRLSLSYVVAVVVVVRNGFVELFDRSHSNGISDVIFLVWMMHWCWCSDKLVVTVTELFL